jgi:hypothetical protein
VVEDMVGMGFLAGVWKELVWGVHIRVWRL